MQSRQSFSLWFIVTLTDNICTAILLPLGIHLLVCKHFSVFASSVTSAHNDIILGSGLIYLLSPLSILVTPIFGWLSDIVGRKKLLLIVLYISFTSYIVLLFANIEQNILLALLGAMLLSAGSSMAITQAVIADISKGPQKAYYFALITFIMSPLFLLIAEGTDSILSIITNQPNYINILASGAGVLAFINILIARRYLLEPTNFSSKTKNRTELYFTILRIVNNRPILLLIALLTLLQFGCGLYIESISDYLSGTLGRDQHLFSGLMYFKIAIMSVSLIAFYPLLLKYFNINILLKISLALCFIGTLGSILNVNISYQWISGFFSAMGECLAIAIIWMMLSENTSAQDQGIVMGIKASFWVIAWTLSVILGDYLSHQFNALLPLQLAAVVLAICLLLSFVISTKNSAEVCVSTTIPNEEN